MPDKLCTFAQKFPFAFWKKVVLSCNGTAAVA